MLQEEWRESCGKGYYASTGSSRLWCSTLVHNTYTFPSSSLSPHHDQTYTGLPGCKIKYKLRITVRPLQLNFYWIKLASESRQNPNKVVPKHMTTHWTFKNSYIFSKLPLKTQSGTSLIFKTLEVMFVKAQTETAGLVDLCYKHSVVCSCLHTLIP